MKNRIKQQLMAEMSRRNIDLVTQLFIEQPDNIPILIELVLSHNDKVSTRASWVLEKLSERLYEPATDYVETIILELPNIKISGTRRTIAKVLMLHTIPEKYEGKILDFCITMLESPKEPVAVKANCMTIIFNLLPKYPELKSEIFSIIENQIPYNSVGFKSRFSVLKRQFNI